MTENEIISHTFAINYNYSIVLTETFHFESSNRVFLILGKPIENSLVIINH